MKTCCLRAGVLGICSNMVLSSDSLLLVWLCAIMALQTALRLQGGASYPPKKARADARAAGLNADDFYAFVQNFMLLSEYHEYFFKEKVEGLCLIDLNVGRWQITGEAASGVFYFT